MKTSLYIGHFSEISDLPESQQLALIEQARYEAFVKLKLNIKDIQYKIFCIFIAFTIPLTLMLIFGSSIIGLLAFSVSLFLSFYTYKALYHKLLARGLKSLLSEVDA